MRSVIESLIESIAHAVQSKIANILLASGTAGGAQALKVASKAVDPVVCTDAAGKIIRCPEKFINLAEVGFLGINALNWITIISCFYIILCILEKVGFYKLLSYLWEKYRFR